MTWEKDEEKQIEMGQKVEKEHALTYKSLPLDESDFFISIALDHLNEDPFYYTRLKKMEQKARKDQKACKKQCKTMTINECVLQCLHKKL